MPGLEWVGVQESGASEPASQTSNENLQTSTMSEDTRAEIWERLDESQQNGSEPSTAEEQQHKGKVCILCIDGGGMRGIIPGRVLDHLEKTLQSKSKNPDARIADYFDVVGGTSVGGILATMLFTAGIDGKPLFTGEQTWKLIAEKGKSIFKIPMVHQIWAKLRGIITPRYSTRYLEALLKSYLVRDDKPLTLRDTLKPVLIPCYDLERAGPLIFSRASALMDENWNFNLWEICRATSAVPSFFKPTYMESVNGKTTCTGIDGGLVMNNPTAAAITHVLHNKVEFPNVHGVSDMLVLSLGTGQFDQKYPRKSHRVRHWGAFQWAKPVVRIVLDGISDMVDQTVSMSFGANREQYLRIQVSGLPGRALMQMDDGSSHNVKRLTKLADDVLTAQCMEHLPFGGRKPVMNTSNRVRIDWFAEQLLLERGARQLRKTPTVNLKPSASNLGKLFCPSPSPSRVPVST